MKLSALGSTLMAATLVVATPAFAKHAHRKNHAISSEMHMRGGKHAKASRDAQATEDLNMRSLQQAQMPVPATAPMAAPSVSPTEPAPAPMPSSMMPSSSMPAPMPAGH